MTYDEYKATQRRYFAELIKYKLDQVGSTIFCEKMASLEDDYPEFAEAFDAELEIEHLASLKSD